MLATVRVLLALGLLGVAVWAATSQPASENLVKNGSFETPGPFGQIGAPDQWEGVAMGTFPAIAQDCTTAHHGKCSMKVMSDKFVMASVLQEASLKPDQYYRLTAWVKTENFSTQGSADMYGSVVVLPNNVEDESKVVKGPNHGATTDWVKMTIEFRGDEKQPMNIMCNYCGQGTGKGLMWFDDLQIVPIDKPTATASAPAGEPGSPKAQTTRPAASRPE